MDPRETRRSTRSRKETAPAPAPTAISRGALAVALAMVAAAGATPVRAQHFPPASDLEALIRSRVDEGRSVGIVLGVLEADGSGRVVAYGDPGPGAPPLDASSVFEIGSITKVFTGIVLAEMEAEGLVTLDAPIQAYAHEGVRMPARGGVQITFADLATHRSALPRLPGGFAPADPSNPYADYTVDQMHEFLSGYEPTRDIGSEYEYSNLAVGLEGHLLAKVAGTSYETLVRDRILDPLGMTMTGVELRPEMRDHLAIGHGADGAPTSLWDIPTLAGAGALRSTMTDMLAFLRANIGEPETALQRAMRRSHQPRRPAAANMDVGLNWHILSVGDDRIVWHNGGTGGYRTFIGFDPARGVGAVVLTNSAHGADDIGFHLINEAVPLAPAPVAIEDRVEIELPRRTLERYVGTYRLTADFAMEVTLGDEGLFVQATNQPRFRLYAEAEDRFFLKAVDAQLTFLENDRGEIASLVLHQGGASQTATREP